MDMLIYSGVLFGEGANLSSEERLLVSSIVLVSFLFIGFLGQKWINKNSRNNDEK